MAAHEVWISFPSDARQPSPAARARSAAARRVRKTAGAIEAWSHRRFWITVAALALVPAGSALVVQQKRAAVQERRLELLLEAAQREATQASAELKSLLEREELQKQIAALPPRPRAWRFDKDGVLVWADQ